MSNHQYKGVITNYGEGGGGLQNGRGRGQVKFYTYKKGGRVGRKSFSHDEGRALKVFR